MLAGFVGSKHVNLVVWQRVCDETEKKGKTAPPAPPTRVVRQGSHYFGLTMPPSRFKAWANEIEDGSPGL